MADDGGSKDIWNVGKLLPDYTALQPRRQPSSYSPPWEPLILLIYTTVIIFLCCSTCKLQWYKIKLSRNFHWFRCRKDYLTSQKVKFWTYVVSPRRPLILERFWLVKIELLSYHFLLNQANRTKKLTHNFKRQMKYVELQRTHPPL
jgi:hypothetical protein